MDPQTVLRFVKTVHGWPGKVVVVGCEPADVENLALELLRAGQGRGRPGRGRRARGAQQAAVRRGLRPELTMHELSLATGIVETVEKHADGSPGDLRPDEDRHAAPGRSRVPRLLLRHLLAKHRLRGRRRSSRRCIPARLRCHACGRRWELDLPDFRCRSCSGTDVEVVAGTEFEVDSIEVQADQPTRRRRDASHQGEGRRGRSRREHDDRGRRTGTTSITPACAWST